MARNSTERVSSWQVRSGVEMIRVFSPAHHSRSQHSSSIETCVIKLVLKGVVFDGPELQHLGTGVLLMLGLT